ncbi:MAG: hypothetical protein OXF76_06720 [Caldilineaceae bacterium]|nr:hypothetical protein [Caldilineaceae bacterium]
MAKTPCRGVRKDGTPCRGNGLKQLDGYCIGHASPEKTRAWRVRGGQNSSTAARADKRIPERLRDAINEVRAGMTAVKEGTMTPAAYNAICRGANTLVKLYQAADTEMDEVRAEEKNAAAAAVYGLHGDLEVLETADELADSHERYHIESLVAQGFVAMEDRFGNKTGKTLFRNQPVLTDAGRLRFGHFPLIGNSYLVLNETEEEVMGGNLDKDSLASMLSQLGAYRDLTEHCRETLAAPPPDPFTGQPLGQLPPSVDKGLPTFLDPADDPAELMDELLEEHNELIEKMRNVYQESYGPLPRDSD